MCRLCTMLYDAVEVLYQSDRQKRCGVRGMRKRCGLVVNTNALETVSSEGRCSGRAACKANTEWSGKGCG